MCTEKSNYSEGINQACLREIPNYASVANWWSSDKTDFSSGGMHSPAPISSARPQVGEQS